MLCRNENINTKYVYQKYCRICVTSGDIPTAPWTISNAYALGALASDGSLDKRKGKFSFGNTEPTFMEALLQTLGDTHIPRLIPLRNGVQAKPFERLIITNHEFYNLCTQVGLRPNKSRSMGHNGVLRLPTDDAELFWMVFRGLFDGDGSISLYNSNKPNFRMKLLLAIKISLNG